MAFRRPAAQRKSPSWRRSGNESYWESLMSEGEFVPNPQRAPRPQSAIEGARLDDWLEHLQTLQNPTEAPPLHDRTTTTRRMGDPSYSRRSSSCESSNLGSQESIPAGFIPISEHRRSWERAHIMEAPQKEQAHLCSLSPVKFGWLPIQRKVMGLDDGSTPNQMLDQCPGQLRPKQPITPTLQKNRAPLYGGGERSHTSSGALRGRTWWTRDPGSPSDKEVPEKSNLPDNEKDRPLSWQALRRGWMTSRTSVLPGVNRNDDLLSGTSSDQSRKSPLLNTNSPKPSHHSPFICTASADPYSHHPTLLQGETGALKPHKPLQRTHSLQPLKATTPLTQKGNAEPSQAGSEVTTLIPQNKTSISSITISSRKVSRTASLPGCTTSTPSSQTSSSPSPTLDEQPMDPNSRQLRVQRKATIVKVTEQRVTSSAAPNIVRAKTPPEGQGSDTVVRRRKATIIKVTEHKESYSPAKAPFRNPEYRHSYTEGVFQNKSTWGQGSHSGSNGVRLISPSNSISRPNTSDTEKHDTLHTSTLSLFVSKPAVTAGPVFSEVSPKASGRRSDTLHRPLSCYGKLTGHFESSQENRAQTDARKWSLGFVQGTHRNSGGSGSINTSRAAREAGQSGADTQTANREEKVRLEPSVDRMRRTSPSLTLIKAPDPHSHQSQAEVLALNAAAIIANIKLQRQFNQRRISSDNLEESIASPQGDPEFKEERNTKLHPEQNDHNKKPLATFVPLRLDQQRSDDTISLQQALQLSRPDFIFQSQSRVRELERKAQERKQGSGFGDQQMGAELSQKGDSSTQCTSVNGDPFKPRGRATMQPQMHTGSHK
ncbi:uncharacterized protein LOC105356574 isoform X1 [Oryzias latipes]|uniref:uncharacterized protein LOC105356574 isoform X1 n=1 Tax=Oryzias latipes TaxID=8090 RepID=UPI0009D9B3F1|nr:uncharacterized protein LOC105356574 isoform X1 [Oryzias latipes]XP_023805470.1 uncharacterized protein LOC105356574 isoform X1 [Oryzias latipes]